MKKFNLILLAALCAFVSCSGTSGKENGPLEPDNASKVKLTLHNGNDTRVVSVEKGVVLGSEPSWRPRQQGRLFKGWFRDPAAKDFFDFEKEQLEGPIDLYAGFVREITLSDKGKVARVTGNSWNESLPNPNQTARKWNLGGTDLGIIWEMSDGKYGVVFGDSYASDFVAGVGGPGAASDWRSNVLGFSENTDLENGLKFTSMYHHRDGEAAALIERENYYGFTYIPTSAICLNGTEYVHFMYWEVGSRDRVKENYSSFIKSSDCGKTWERCKGEISFSYDSYFCMVGLGKKEGDPYCYMMGAQSGNGYRQSTAKLARFTYDNILNKSQYEYWNSGKGEWIRGKEDQASTVLDGTVGELSLMYLDKYEQWLTMYFDAEKYAICYRTAARPQGPWSEERIICAGRDYPQLYGSFIHPYSAKSGSQDIYWTMSQWAPYNVFLMKSTIN